MADFFWRVRYRAAAAALLGGSAILALLDFAARSTSNDVDRVLTGLVLVLSFSAVVSSAIPWDRLRTEIRLIPAVIVLGATALAILAADSDTTTYAPVGLTIVAVLVMTYVGFSTSPGWALGVSPVVLVTLLLAYQRNPSRISLALPLVAVPIAALVAELTSVLRHRVDRGDRESKRRLERLGRLEDVLRRFRRPSDINEAARQVAEAALEIFEVTRSTVVLRDSRGNLIPVSSGPTVNSVPGVRTAELIADTINGDEPRLVPTGTNGTMLVLPLPAPEAPAGAVLVYPVSTEDAAFTLDLARLFGVQISIAIDHLYVIDELARASTRDALTGIGNRRHADALLASLKTGDALVVLDLDYLKTVNDTMGHAAGDQVLQELSAHLRTVLRDSDTSARLGGDEFLVVARRAHADPLAVASRILAGWDGKGGLTTLSAGVALHDPEVTSAETFDRADRALYQAKRAGRDQARLWTEDDDPKEIAGPETPTPQP